MSRVMRKQTICICENKDADHLRGNREADQRLCFRYIDSTISLLSKSEISSLKPSSVAVQPGLFRTRSEIRMLVFSGRGSYIYFYSQTPTAAFVGPVIIDFHNDLNYLFDIINIHSITA